MAMNLTFDGTQLTCGETVWTLDRPIVAARLLNDCVFIVFDWMTYEPEYQPSNNLEAFDLDGNRLWVVTEHPVSGGACAYTQFGQSEDLIVGHFAGYDCQFDPATGKLLKSVFTK